MTGSLVFPQTLAILMLADVSRDNVARVWAGPEACYAYIQNCKEFSVVKKSLQRGTNMSKKVFVTAEYLNVLLNVSGGDFKCLPSKRLLQTVYPNRSKINTK